ncbi:MAG: hypothetical protein V4792_02310 [Pseudomonadota bacterium]
MIATPSQRLACIAFATALAALLGACALAPPTLAPERIAQVLAASDRSAADRGNDLRRKPAQMLAFIGLRPGMIALDLSAGGGYTTELLARAIGSGGQVYGQSPPPRQPAPARTSAMALAEREARLRGAGVAAAPLLAVAQRFEDPVPAALAQSGLDLVTLMFNYHDLGHLGVDRAEMNRAVFRALKPGAFYVIADHSGRPGTGISESGTLHRIEEAFLRREVEAAGFRLAGEGQFLRNPNDPRDQNTPDPAQPKDEFVLKFVKP